jgi:hypothetical protein
MYLYIKAGPFLAAIFFRYLRNGLAFIVLKLLSALQIPILEIEMIIDTSHLLVGVNSAANFFLYYLVPILPRVTNIGLQIFVLHLYLHL